MGSLNKILWCSNPSVRDQKVSFISVVVCLMIRVVLTCIAVVTIEWIRENVVGRIK